jgi:hypothetical protein
MTLNPNFTFQPTPEIQNPEMPFPGINGELGPLHVFLDDGKPAEWIGDGFNNIWRPNSTPQSDHFLELNATHDKIRFERIAGDIPNRGLLQPDIKMFGLSYLQQIKDANVGDEGLHFEPGIWAVVPKTSAPTELPTVVRMASIPHGTVILAQGSGFQHPGPPAIQANSITPFPIGNPSKPITFKEATLATPSDFRTAAADLTGITQAMLDNPNSFLTAALAGQTVKETTTLIISTDASAPVLGGGTANTAFLQGAPSTGPNAQAAEVTATFWIERIEGDPDFFQLQYTQRVLLNFAGLSWPHITVATLRKHSVP